MDNLIPATENTMPLFKAIRNLEAKGESFVGALRRVVSEQPELFERARADMPGDFADRLLRQLETIGEARLHTEPIALGRAQGAHLGDLAASDLVRQVAAERDISLEDAYYALKRENPLFLAFVRSKYPAAGNAGDVGAARYDPTRPSPERVTFARNSLVAEIDAEAKTLAAEKGIGYADALALIRKRDPERFASAVAP